MVSPVSLGVGDTLRDIAALRKNRVDLAGLLPPLHPVPNDPQSATVNSSYDYVKSARRTLQIADAGAVEQHGQRLEAVRDTLEGVAADLQSRNSVRMVPLLYPSYFSFTPFTGKTVAC